MQLKKSAFDLEGKIWTVQNEKIFVSVKGTLKSSEETVCKMKILMTLDLCIFSAG